jgi:uncharacterized protein (AIM24 family)
MTAVATFTRTGSRVLSVALAGDSVRARTGSMIAFEGDLTFRHAGMGGGEGLRGALKRRVTGESLALMEVSGHGTVHLAHEATQVEVVDIEPGGGALAVEASALLAVSAGLRTDVTFAGLRGATSGQGLFTTTVAGTGQVAILSDGPAVVLGVSPDTPLVVEPDAYVASRGQLSQTFVTDVSWRTAIGEGSGEAYSLRFAGTGLVYIQPAER